MVVMAAADEAELVHMITTAAAHDTGPIAFRYPRGTGTGVSIPQKGELLQIGKGRIVRPGADIALLSFGGHLAEALKAADLISAQGIDATVADARFAKPLDHALISKLAKTHKVLITIEQGAQGGFGAMVLHYLADTGLLDGPLAVRSMTLPDRFIDQAAPDAMYADAGINRDRYCSHGLTGPQTHAYLSLIMQGCAPMYQKSDHCVASCKYAAMG